MKQSLTHLDYQNAAEQLGVEVASVYAVTAVESAGSGFIRAGLPKILFERHIFYRRLIAKNKSFKKLVEQHPQIINPVRGGYQGGLAEYERLKLARSIDDDAANESASWGAFQIMGFHWATLAFKNVTDFVAAQSLNAASQLNTFIRFIHAQPNLLTALQAQDWARFARFYNGPAYQENRYDVKLAQAYQQYGEKTA